VGPLAQASPTFPEPLEGVEEGVDAGAAEELEAGAAEELEELEEGAAAAEDDWGWASLVGAGLGAAVVTGAADEVETAALLRLVEGRGLQRFVELSWRFLLLNRERRAITS